MLKRHAMRLLERTAPRWHAIRTSITQRRRNAQEYLQHVGRRIFLTYQRLRQPATLPALYAAIDQHHYARWQHWQLFLDAKEAQLAHQRSPVDVDVEG